MVTLWSVGDLAKLIQAFGRVLLSPGAGWSAHLVKTAGS